MIPPEDASAPASAVPARRFRVALSFPGAKREFVRKVAEELAENLGRERVFYDNWHRAELAQPDLDVLLSDLYYRDAELIVPFFCHDYAERDWCELELRQMRALQLDREGWRIMPFRFDGGEIKGVRRTDGFITIAEDTAANRADTEKIITSGQVAALIMERLALPPRHEYDDDDDEEEDHEPAGDGHGGERTRPLIDPLHSLPRAPKRFTGRAAELELLRAADPADPPVIRVLRGMGGVGKTALALALANEWKAQYPDAQIMLDGVGLSDAAPAAEVLMEKVIHAFRPGQMLPAGRDAVQSIYTSILEGKRALLLLDNARGMVQAEPLVPPAGCAFIVTSRQGFPVNGKTPHPVGRLEEAEARELLRKHYTPGITDAEAQELWTLCAGLPAALRLAGAYLLMEASNQTEPADVAGYLERLRKNRLEALDRGAADGDGEVPTITETLRLSELSLTPSQQSAWHALGIFPAPFDDRAALAVSGMDADTLTALVRRSLVEREKGRLKLHDLAAEYACSRLDPATLEERWTAYVVHYTTIAIEANQAYASGGDGELQGLRIFDAARLHIEAAFAWLKGRGDRESAMVLMALVNVLTFTTGLRFQPSQRISWLEAQLAGARQHGIRQAEGMALYNLGMAHRDYGDPQAAIRFFSESLPTLREAGERAGEGNVLNGLGMAYADMGDSGTAVEYYLQALPIMRETGNTQWLANTLNNLGMIYTEMGKPREAVPLLEEALGLARDRRAVSLEGTVLNNLGLACIGLRELPAALDYCRKNLDIAHRTGDRRAEGTSLQNIGYIHSEMGEPAEAMKYYLNALPLLRAAHDRRMEGMLLTNMGLAAVMLNDERGALKYCEEALPILRATGNRRGESAALQNMSTAYIALNEPEAAIDCSSQVLSLLSPADAGQLAGRAHNNIGMARLALGATDKALASFAQALAISRETGDRLAEVNVLWNTAHALRSGPTPAQAIPAGEEALKICEEMHFSADTIRTALEQWKAEPEQGGDG
ncbi:MAG TPA: tetratricopeptide repeat protein [Verrucomicrobiales bacterium]|nr:tetratricopeptide repeat protein [Verrucomicrobiales bacterium]